MDLENIISQVAANKQQELDRWNIVKKEVSTKANPPSFRQGEIWWAAVGENIGIEINGKDQNFQRPVLIIKKLSNYGFIGLPMTSQAHAQNHWWYASFIYRSRVSELALAQVRTMSALRLFRKMGKISRDDFERIKADFLRFLS